MPRFGRQGDIYSIWKLRHLVADTRFSNSVRYDLIAPPNTWSFDFLSQDDKAVLTKSSRKLAHGYRLVALRADASHCVGTCCFIDRVQLYIDCILSVQMHGCVV